MFFELENFKQMFWCKISRFENSSKNSSMWTQQSSLDIIKINDFDIIIERKWKKMKEN
jgi:hypothetical protein